MSDPSKYQWHIATLNSSVDGIPIRYAVATRGSQEAKRYVVLANGRTEWIEKYDYFPDRLDLPSDCGFVTWDHRGQGASGGARAYVATYEHFVTDAVSVLNATVRNCPYVVAAHSMGGLITVLGTLTGKLAPQAIAMSGPLFSMPSRPLPIGLMKPLVDFVSKIGLGTITSGAAQHQRWPFKHNKLTHSLEMYRKVQRSQYRIPGATFGWASASFAAIETIFQPELLKNLALPVLVMAGSDDIAVNPEGFGQWITLAKSLAKAPVQLSIIHGGKHELFAEAPPYIDETFRHMKLWFAPFLS